MGEGDGHGLDGIGRGVNTHVGDEIAGFVDSFQTLDGDVFTILHLDEILQSVTSEKTGKEGNV